MGAQCFKHEVHEVALLCGLQLWPHITHMFRVQLEFISTPASVIAVVCGSVLVGPGGAGGMQQGTGHSKANTHSDVLMVLAVTALGLSGNANERQTTQQVTKDTRNLLNKECIGFHRQGRLSVMLRDFNVVVHES
jgi:hypothetical protein